MKRNKLGEAPNYSSPEIKIALSDNWRTPHDLFEKLDREFKFVYDLAADENNCLLPRYYTKEDDALKHVWFANSFANIPYSGPSKWFAKAPLEVRNEGRTIVFLVKVATSENYWKEAAKDMHVRFLHGRIKFWDETNTPRYGATFPSALLIFSPNTLGNGNMSLWNYKLEIPEKIV